MLAVMTTVCSCIPHQTEEVGVSSSAGYLAGLQVPQVSGAFPCGKGASSIEPHKSMVPIDIFNFP